MGLRGSEVMVRVIQEQRRSINRQSHGLRTCSHTQATGLSGLLWRQSCQRKHFSLAQQSLGAGRIDDTSTLPGVMVGSLTLGRIGRAARGPV